MQKLVLWRKHGLALFKQSIGSLSGATTPGKSRPGSDGNKGVLRIPQSSCITGTIRLFSVISRTLVGRVYPSANQTVSSNFKRGWLHFTSSSSSSSSCHAASADIPDPLSPLLHIVHRLRYPQIATVCMFELVVLLLLSHSRGSLGVRHLWARSCFSSGVLHVWFV